MSANKKPRKAYRPKNCPPVPLTFASSPAMLLQLGVRSRQAIDAVIGHTANVGNLVGLETETVSALHLLTAARKSPDQCPFDAASLEAVEAELRRIATSVHSIVCRHRDTGRIGCAGHERADLLALADLLDQLREAFPRRLWHEAYRLGVMFPTLTLEEQPA